MKFLLSTLPRLGRPLSFALGALLIAALGVLDFLTGYELSFSLFYVLPIALVTWQTDRRLGLLASVVSALVWLGADIASEHPYTHPLIPLWNSLIRFAFFIIITLLLAALKRALEREKELAQTDFLTGAVNSRLFFSLVRMENDRSRRHDKPLTLAYIDLDNFKVVNDKMGHSTGDEVLRVVVNSCKKHLRKTDVVARLGGDEFALLLPETDQVSAKVVLPKIQSGLLEEMVRYSWPVTFSIGVLTCTAPADSIDQLVSMADELMYTVKRESKNAIRYARHPA